MKNNKRGLFIVLEGLNKCGKSSQTKLLREALEAKKIQFPNRSTSMGSIISDYLKGKRDINDQVIHLLFSYQIQKQFGIPQQKHQIKESIQFVIDKHILLWYFILQQNFQFNGVSNVIQVYKKTDLLIYLRAPIKQLKDKDDFRAERYEKQEFQQQDQEFFNKMAQQEQFNIINALQTKEEIFTQIMDLINADIQNALIIQQNNFGAELSHYTLFIFYKLIQYFVKFFESINQKQILYPSTLNKKIIVIIHFQHSQIQFQLFSFHLFFIFQFTIFYCLFSPLSNLFNFQMNLSIFIKNNGILIFDFQRNYKQKNLTTEGFKQSPFRAAA
ncbi:unnamed protein product [Paramecium pentaurelia]|uniref:Thymidylate kinase-like domain-containing protein n=1 Tax=Paramecium pentaurelia TaxID=43138 RepID=A0A8S1VMF1_9CILI|nr:unnamed protein product [Paramecium pentaurelia]